MARHKIILILASCYLLFEGYRIFVLNQAAIGLDPQGYSKGAIPTASKPLDLPVNLWIFAIAETGGTHQQYMQQAVLSAKRQHQDPVHRLYMLCLFYGSNKKTELWLKSQGVMIANMQGNNFVKKIVDLQPISLGIGAWLRLVIPQTLKALTSKDGEYAGIVISRDTTSTSQHNNFTTQALQQMNTELVLYTDADILFLKNIVNDSVLQSYSKYSKPTYIAAALQGNFACCSESITMRKTGVNSGVLLMNVPRYSSVWHEFKPFVLKYVQRAVAAKEWVSDQGALKHFFPIKMSWTDTMYASRELLFSSTHWTDQMITKHHADILPKSLQWEPYLGISEHAAILHWHGPKLWNIDCTDRSITREKKNSGSILRFLETSPGSINETHIIQENKFLALQGNESRKGYAHAVRLFLMYRKEVCNPILSKNKTKVK